MSDLARGETALNLRRLGYFVAVADELHFGRAADSLHVAQPALSQQIRLLETELGMTLFDRTTRRVALSSQGADFLPHARRLLSAADGVSNAARELRDGARGRLRLGFVDSAAYEFVPRFLHRFRTVSPGVEVQLQTLSSDEQAEALREGRIDLGVTRAVAPGVDLVSTVLGTERLLVATTADAPFADQQSVRLSRLRDAALVGFDRGRSPTLHGELVALLRDRGVAYDPAIEAGEYTTILGLVAAGEGVALVPSGISSLQLPGVTYVRIADRGATLRLVLVSRADEARAVVVRAMVEFDRLAAARNAAGHPDPPQADVVLAGIGDLLGHI